MKLNFITSDNFRASKPNGGQIPEARYRLQITALELNEWKGSDYVDMTLTITGGQYDGRNIWPKFMMAGPDDKKVQIGRALFANITKALDIEHVRDSSQLLGRFFEADLSWSKPYNNKQYPNLRNVGPDTEPTGTTPGLEAVAGVFGSDISSTETDRVF